MYALTLDPEGGSATDGTVGARLLQVKVNGVNRVALFTDKQLVAAWLATNAPNNSVFRPLELADKPSVIGFLTDLASNGDTHVCIDPTDRAGNVAEIARLVALVGGLD